MRLRGSLGGKLKLDEREETAAKRMDMSLANWSFGHVALVLGLVLPMRVSESKAVAGTVKVAFPRSFSSTSAFNAEILVSDFMTPPPLVSFPLAGLSSDLTNMIWATFFFADVERKRQADGHGPWVTRGAVAVRWQKHKFKGSSFRREKREGTRNQS